MTLVKNLCLDFLRSPRANRRDADVTEAVTLSTASSPDEELERQDKVQQIRHLIDRLPENQRQVLRLRGIEDCSMDEIEQITGLSAVNIRVLLSRARKIIREQLENIIHMNMDDKKIDELINKALQEEQALPEGLSRRLEKQIDTWASTEERRPVH